jgi:hypothetical protein
MLLGFAVLRLPGCVVAVCMVSFFYFAGVPAKVCFAFGVGGEMDFIFRLLLPVNDL